MNNNFIKYSSQFRKKALDNGFSEDNIAKCLKYAEPILSKNFPIIYNTSHFCSLVGYNKSYVKRAVAHTKYFYREFNIKKKDKTHRTISEPLPSLKEIQNWILLNILYKHKVSKYCKGYVPKRSVKDHVRYHTKELCVFTLDIKDFFASIKFEFVEQIFLNIGYSASLSNLFTKLCFLR